MDDIDCPDNTFFLPLDLSNLDSVRKFADSFRANYDRLDVLVNNAGVELTDPGLTQQGFETQFGCNHVAHFLLFKLLAPMLLKTAETTGKPSRFVALSSAAAAHIQGAPLADICYDDLNFESRKYDRTEAYCQSKLANYLHVIEASKQYDSAKLICVAVHPG
jgi:NAD(P)-dependent dehydrogenase (short-subunit alcohol dehydrogenase family)